MPPPSVWSLTLLLLLSSLPGLGGKARGQDSREEDAPPEGQRVLEVRRIVGAASLRREGQEESALREGQALNPGEGVQAARSTTVELVLRVVEGEGKPGVVCDLSRLVLDEKTLFTVAALDSGVLGSLDAGRLFVAAGPRLELQARGSLLSLSEADVEFVAARSGMSATVHEGELQVVTEAGKTLSLKGPHELQVSRKGRTRPRRLRSPPPRPAYLDRLWGGGRHHRALRPRVRPPPRDGLQAQRGR